ncbi:MAG: TonB-dependent receptor [Pyrinomonadaceae bacterium]
MKAKSRIIYQIFLFKRFVWLLGALLAIGFGQNVFASDAGAIKGTVRATSGAAANAEATVIAGAKLTLVNKATPNQPFKTVSNAAGDFIFDNLPAGDYTLTIEAVGLASASREIKLTSGALLTLEIDLSATISETVTIRDEEGLLSTSETATSNIVRAETLKAQPLRTDNFQNAIQLTPGAIRDGYGNNYLKGTRTGQSGYTVNGADVTDPVTGNLAFDIPLEAAQSVQIQENPYSAEFGRFTGGVTNLQTKGGGDKFKISAARFFPTFHNIFSSQIDSFRPRVTLSGPVIAKKVFFLQSFEYRFSRIFVPSQPAPANNIAQEGFNSFTQIDWNVNKNNSLKFNAAIFPAKFRNLGLDTFNSAPATPDYKQRGALFSVSEQAVFKDASFLSSEISYKTFDVDVYAKSSLPFNVAPEANYGGYFADTRRRTKRIQWQETYYSRPLKFYGEHSIKTGFEFDNTKIGGQFRYNSIFIRRTDGTLARRVDFTNAAPLDFSYHEAAVFAQDRWIVNPKLTFDYGLRFDRDGVTKNNNLAPRFSFLFLPLKNERTIIRGGIGIFYDRSLAIGGLFEDGTTNDELNPTAEFEQIPERIVTDYAANGASVVGAPRLFSNKIAEPLRTPRSVRWSVQLDRGITKNLTARVGFLQRFTKNDLIVDPVINGNSGNLLLSSRGRSRYDETQFLLAYNKEKLGQWNASYIFSRARGDLNTADVIFGDTPAFVVRPNQYGRLPFDAPHHLLFYGQLEISQKYDIRLAPLFEVRSGFPFSAVNERLDFIGARDATGRFPMYLSLDVQVTKGFKIPFIFKDKRLRVGVAVLNVTNHFNPRDVQMNLTSANYGKFYNSLGTSVKAKFDVDF